MAYSFCGFAVDPQNFAFFPILNVGQSLLDDIVDIPSGSGSKNIQAVADARGREARSTTCSVRNLSANEFGKLTYVLQRG